MSATQILIQLLGSVALLLWGLRTVQTGINRGFGPVLRDLVQRNTDNRFKAFFVGVIVTMLVQSSTATTLITASFARSGFLSLAAGLAIILGADVGTTIVAQILSLDLSALPYVLFFAGFLLHKANLSSRWRQVGRISMGLAMMLFALRFILLSVEPVRQSVVLQDIFAALLGEPILAVAVAAIIALMTYSSLATVLLIASLVFSKAIPVDLGILLVLGANLGGTLPPILSTLQSGAVARQITAGNAIMKGLAVLVCVPFAAYIPSLLDNFGMGGARVVINFHMMFNVCVALVFLPTIGPLSRLLSHLIEDNPNEEQLAGPRILDSSLIENPVLALNAASREAINMASHVEEILRGTRTALDGAPSKEVDDLLAIDDVIDRYYEGIKLYVTTVTRQEMSDSETHRAAEILLFVTNLEHIGDISENILEMAVGKAKSGLEFSEEGWAELLELHTKVADNLNLATGVFMSNDVAVARALLEEKLLIGKMQRQMTENHMERLRNGTAESIATSSLHLDIIRDLRRVHSHITAVAYPVLEAAGALRKSRLKKRS
jgi:phosphate:Na+ symporter